jgi:uncharacterized membrane protein YeaQ/YmgE (transglycosylase-associated protein family)
MDTIGLVAWIIVGALTGWLASALLGTRVRSGWLVDLIVGIVGAIAGGLLFFWIITPNQTAFNIWSLLVAFLGVERLLVGNPRTTGD